MHIEVTCSSMHTRQLAAINSFYSAACHPAFNCEIKRKAGRQEELLPNEATGTQSPSPCPPWPPPVSTHGSTWLLSLPVAVPPQPPVGKDCQEPGKLERNYI